LAPVHKILVIRIRAFGDTLLSTPALRGLKKAYPEAKLSVLVEPAMAVLLRGLPYVDEIITFDRQGSKKGGWWGELKANLKLWLDLRERKFDLVVDVLGTPRTAWIALFTGAPVRVGFAFRIRRFAYNVVHWPSKERKYIADYTADALRALGHEPDSLKLDFHVPEASRAKARELLKESRPLIVQAAGGWELKRYPEAQLAEAIRQILAKKPMPVLYLWGPGEEGMAESLRQAAGVEGSLAPRTDFADMAALLERGALLLTNDNATKHLAVAVGCPTLTVFGPTSDVAWHPPADPRHRSVKLELDCMPCEALTCRLGTHACMKELAPASVAQAALEMLQ
jgi:lipopolysaccharide heptosyltransferase II